MTPRILGLLFSGFAVRVAAIGLAVAVAYPAISAITEALGKASAALNP